MPPQATFEDSLLEEAQAKKHCTTREAVEAGAAAGAFRTLLTHFSQRYPKIPVVDENFQAGCWAAGLLGAGGWVLEGLPGMGAAWGAGVLSAELAAIPSGSQGVHGLAAAARPPCMRTVRPSNPVSPLPPRQGTVGIAFDLMSVNLADVGRLPAVVPALKLLFAEEEEAGEDGEEAEPQPAMLQ